MIGKVYLMRPLLEYLAERLGCMYLSNLCYLPAEMRAKLAYEIRLVPLCAAPAREWQDALLYLTGEKEVLKKTAEGSRERLLAWLEK